EVPRRSAAGARKIGDYLLLLDGVLLPLLCVGPQGADAGRRKLRERGGVDSLQSKLLRIVAAQPGGGAVKQPVDVCDATAVHAARADGAGPVRGGAVLLVGGGVGR